MRTNPLPRPAAVDIVPASEVGALIEETDRAFTELERRAVAASAAADEADRQAQDVGVDPKSAAWTMVRLQRFLDSLRLEAARDAQATHEVATHRARMRVDDARASRGASRRPSNGNWSAPGDRTEVPEARPVPAPREFQPNAAVPTDGMNPGPVAPTSATPPGVAQSRVEPEPAPDPPVARAVAVPMPQVVAPTNGHAPSNGSDPTGVQGAVATTTLRPRPEPARAQTVPATTPEAARFAAPVVAAPIVAPVASAPAKAAKKPGLLRRLPIAAILEVIAVLLVLVFILLRLS